MERDGQQRGGVGVERLRGDGAFGGGAERACDELCDCFFFQAEDGIRDYKVTGVQTCALPICGARGLGGSYPIAKSVNTWWMRSTRGTFSTRWYSSANVLPGAMLRRSGGTRS